MYDRHRSAIQGNPEGVTFSMAGTFSQIYVQVVFAVKGRENQLERQWRVEVFKYMAGIVNGRNQKSIM